MAVLELADKDIWQLCCCRLRISLGEDIWMPVLELAGEDILLLSFEDISGRGYLTGRVRVGG